MSYQRRLLPSISMLMSYDAAARAGSFTAAAHELNVTQGAVSRQIGALENQLGIELFKRDHKPLQLTSVGKIYAVEVSAALQSIRNASLAAITKPRTGVLNLAILPTFGTRWLMPRFPSFLEQYPDITVNFVTKLSPFDFANENIHVAIHYGLPDWPGTKNTFLMGEMSVPVCAPGMIEDHPIDHVSDIAKLPLLHLASRPDAWESWFRAVDSSVSVEHGLVFEQFSTIAQAAVAGLGAGLLPRFLINRELSQDELVVIVDEPLQSDYGYYLISPNNHLDYEPVVAFRTWILSLAESFQAEASS
jgi:LysR family glycine cleavage system transcriptional activator